MPDEPDKISAEAGQVTDEHIEERLQETLRSVGCAPTPPPYDFLEDMATYVAAALPGSGTPAREAARAVTRLVQALDLTTSSKREEILDALRKRLH